MSIKICGITTRDMTMKSFMVDTFNYFADNGFDVVIICEPSDNVREAISPQIKYYPISMKSGIESPFRMITIIRKMVHILKKEKIQIVQYASTNAGLYAAIAASICGIPNRIFCQWGMMYVGSKGVKRTIFKTIEKTICTLSTSVQSDSCSNAEYAVQDGIVNSDKCEVIWNGSSTGVDISKFLMKDKSSVEIINRKCDLGLRNDTFVFGFIGRINREKGINELLDAFCMLLENSEVDVELVLIGPKESDVLVNEKLEGLLNSTSSIHYYGMSNEVEKYYDVMDCFIFPSYREGIATVLLEACASGLPIISTNINGSIDVVTDGFNGYLCDPKSTVQLVTCMKKMLNLDKNDFQRMRTNSRHIAVKKFDHEKLVQYLMEDRIKRVSESK